MPKGDRMMVNAIQTWTPWLWPTFLLHPPVWYQHILLSTTDSAAGCAAAPAAFHRMHAWAPAHMTPAVAQHIQGTDVLGCNHRSCWLLLKALLHAAGTR